VPDIIHNITVIQYCKNV